MRAETETVRLIVEQDTNPINWREEGEPLGTMVCWHRRYKLGEVQPTVPPNEWRESLSEEDRPAVELPLYLYDHGGITMSTSSFSYPWNSGQVGFIYMTALEIRREFAGDEEQARKRLQQEVKDYDDYLTGNVWGYRIERKMPCGHWEETDSCWGFYGDPEKSMAGELPEDVAPLLAQLGG